MRVTVVGAGIVGLSAAWALARAGHTSVLLDQGPVPNPHASSHDRHRLIRLAHTEGDGRGITIRDAYAAWDRLWRELGRSHYVETGTLMTARAPSDFASTARAGFDRSGTPYAVWSRAELAERCPFLALGPDDWGLFAAQGGALLADRILDDLAAGLRARGVTIHEHTRVAAVDPDTATATLEGGKQLSADALILATGAWTGRLLPDLAPALEPRRAVVHYLAPPDDHLAGWADAPCFLDLGGDGDLYIVPPLAGLPLKFGAGLTSTPADPDAPRTLRPDEPERQLAVLRPFIRDFDRYRVVDSRVCWTCYTKDERFLAGTRERLAYATGCSGQMFKFGAAMGERLAEAVTGALDGDALSRWTLGEVAVANA